MRRRRRRFPLQLRGLRRRFDASVRGVPGGLLHLRRRLRDGPRLPRRRARAQDLHDDVHGDRVGRRLLSQARHGRPAVLELRGDLPIREAAHLRGGVLHLAVTQNGHRHGNSMATSTTPSANRPRAEQQIGGGGGNRTGVRKHSVWWGRLPRARAPNRDVVMHEATALGFLLAGGDTVALPPTNYGLAATAGFAALSYALPTALARSRRPEAAGGRVVGGSGLTARRPDGERTVAISRSTWDWTRAMQRSVRCTVCFWTRAMLTSTAISVGGGATRAAPEVCSAARTPKHGERY